MRNKRTTNWAAAVEPQKPCNRKKWKRVEGGGGRWMRIFPKLPNVSTSLISVYCAASVRADTLL